MEAVTLTKAECKALYELIDELSGGNAENVFPADRLTDPTCPVHMACAKIYYCADQDIPANLERLLS